MTHKPAVISVNIKRLLTDLVPYVADNDVNLHTYLNEIIETDVLKLQGYDLGVKTQLNAIMSTVSNSVDIQSDTLSYYNLNEVTGILDLATESAQIPSVFETLI